MASNEIRHRARLTKALAPVPLVDGNQSRLGQVFLNLVVNAAQAMPVGQAADNEIRVSTSLDPRGMVIVEVADTGVGIPQDKLERVFDPFFTTKPAGIGTGLGLAICHRIIAELGGRPLHWLGTYLPRRPLCPRAGSAFTRKAPRVGRRFDETGIQVRNGSVRS